MPSFTILLSDIRVELQYLKKISSGRRPLLLLNILVTELTNKTTEKTNIHQSQYIQNFLKNVHQRGFLEVMHAVMAVLVSTGDMQVLGSRHGFRFQLLHYLERIPQLKVTQK